MACKSFSIAYDYRVTILVIQWGKIMGYAKRAVQGVGWNTTLKLLASFIAAGKIVVLARLLTPTDFGIFALVLIALGLSESMTETGINTTIIQSKQSIKYYLDTAWVISILRGLIISLLMMGIGWLMQGFYKQEGLFLLVGFTSLVPFLRGFINPAIVSWQRELRFFRDSMYTLSLTVVEAVTTIILALIFHSVFALIGGVIVSAIFEVVFTFVMFQERPRFQYLHSRANEILWNMWGLNAMTILNYVTENIDDVIIGRVVGTSGLGIYHNSYALSHRLNLQFAKSIQHSTFPIYVKMDEKVRLRKAFFKTLFLSMAGFIVLGVPLLFFPKLVVDILLGAKWSEAIPVLPWLVVAGLIHSVVTIASAVLVARKQYFWLNVNLFMNVVFMIPFLIWLGMHYGLLGAVIGLLFSRTISLPSVLIGVKQVLYD